jgi:hypothetical protein
MADNYLEKQYADYEARKAAMKKNHLPKPRKKPTEKKTTPDRKD